MTLLPTIPNLEAVIGDYVEEHPDVVALGARVSGRLPEATADQVAPWVKVTQLDATDASSGVEHLIDYLMQFDCYAGRDATLAHVGQGEATLLGRTVRAVLKDAQGQSLDSALVITRVAFSGMPRIPDTAYKPPRERVVLTAEIHAHALP